MEIDQLLKMAEDDTGKYSFAILVETVSTIKAMAQDSFDELSNDVGFDLGDHFTLILENVIGDVASKLFDTPEEFHQHLDEIPKIFDTDEVITDQGAVA